MSKQFGGIFSDYLSLSWEQARGFIKEELEQLRISLQGQISKLTNSGGTLAETAFSGGGANVPSYVANTGPKKSAKWEKIDLTNGVKARLKYVSLPQPEEPQSLIGNDGATSYKEIVVDTDLTISSEELVLTETGVFPNPYGNSTHIPSVTIDSKGRITDASQSLISPQNFILRGTRAAQPSAASEQIGTVYYVTDEGKTERSNGTIWQDITDATTGAGDVVGPSSSVASEIALFDGVTGKLIKRATGTGVVHSTSGVYSVGNVALASEASGDLGVSHLNGGTGASSSTFWRGDATWSNVGIVKVIRKASDESVTSSTVLQDDNDFSLSVSNGEIWAIEFWLFVFSASATPKLDYRLSTPTSSTVKAAQDNVVFSVSSQAGDIDRFSQASGSEPNTYVASSGSGGSAQLIRFPAVVVVGSNGTIKLQWAQHVSDGSATTIQANSVMISTRIA